MNQFCSQTSILILLHPNKKAKCKISFTQQLLCFRTILLAGKSSATWARQLSNQHRISNKAGSLLYEAEPPCEPHNRDLRQKQHSYYCVHVCPCLYRHYYFTSSSIVPQSYLSLVKKSKTICLVKYCKTYIYNHSSMQKCLYSACTQMWKIMHKNVLNINRHYFKYQNKQGQSSLNPCTAQ